MSVAFQASCAVLALDALYSSAPVALRTTWWCSLLELQLHQLQNPLLLQTVQQPPQTQIGLFTPPLLPIIYIRVLTVGTFPIYLP